MASVPKESVIRRVSASEWQVFRSHLGRLAPHDRRSRFAGAVSDTFLDRYAAGAFDGDSVVIGAFVDGTMRGAGELRPYRPYWRLRGEAAFSVEAQWQDTGLGGALFARIVQTARNRGLTRLIVLCLAENLPMQAIARRHGARLEREDGDVLGQITPQAATPLSLWREALDEGSAMLDRLLGPALATPPHGDAEVHRG